jgi:hypothetical protein
MSAQKDIFQMWLADPDPATCINTFAAGYEAGIRAAADSIGSENSDTVGYLLRQHILKLLEKS